MSRKSSARRHAPASSHRKRSRSASAWPWAALAAVVLVVAAVILFRPQGAGPAPAATQAPEISIDQAYAEYQQGVFFLDVREPGEWDAFHIPGATLIPLGQLSARLDELPRDQEIVVVCRTGNRSQQGRDTLLAAGFTDVTSMSGGVTAWSNAGYPIEGARP